MMLLLAYESEISLGLVVKFSTTIEKFSTTIEKFLDREVSRSRSVSITIEKCLDYDRQVSRLRSRRFSTTIEKILEKSSFSSRLLLLRSFSIEKVN